MRKIALITGANRGLGFATARRLAEAGMTVVLGARDEALGAAAAANLIEAGLSAESIVLDVTDPASISAAAQTLAGRFGHLDVLVNNAGILPEATAPVAAPLDAALLRTTFETNVFGVAAVIEACLPLLMEAPTGQIVNVSSIMGSLTDQSDPASPYFGVVVPAYQASKATVNAMTVALAKKLAGTTVAVNAVCPGWVQTDLAPGNRQGAPLTAEEASAVVARLAMADPAEGSGAFVDASGPVAW